MEFPEKTKNKVTISSVQFSSVAQSCPTLRNLVNRSTPGLPVHGILQARILEWVATAFSDLVPTRVQKYSKLREKKNTISILISVKLNIKLPSVQFSSVQFSRSVVSDSSQPRESQHARPPCPSPTPRVRSNSCPSSW